MKAMFHGPASASTERVILAAETAGLRIVRFPSLDDLPASAAGANQIPIFLGGLDAVKGFFRDRRGRHGAPVIAIAPEGETDLSPYLDAGADDALRPPVDGREIRARLTAIVRRIAGTATGEMRVGDLSVSLAQGDPTVAGRPVRLSAIEARILVSLAANHPRRVARETLYDSLYALAEDPPQPKVVDVHVSNLRRKLMQADAQGRNFICAVPGVGYGLCDGRA